MELINLRCAIKQSGLSESFNLAVAQFSSTSPFPGCQVCMLCDYSCSACTACVFLSSL